MESWTKKGDEWQPIQSRAEVRRAHNGRGVLDAEKMMEGLCGGERVASDGAVQFFTRSVSSAVEPAARAKREDGINGPLFFSIGDLQVFFSLSVFFLFCFVSLLMQMMLHFILDASAGCMEGIGFCCRSPHLGEE